MGPVVASGSAAFQAQYAGRDIAAAANEWDTDLVVVGTANAEQLVPTVEASILVVRPRQSTD
ncbi:MAG: hypothetical protein K2Q17_18625 [Nitrospiraceae bacterium]|uniref:hypothetical protein n=1 Tax=Nitrospira cf. moscoviensis SBR1015 TaxID=96242 RepID=UPI000A0DA640|nr:hypothetical protein [Nitrospira cf. moscoviensis SBR1015]MBY0249673.1 hypothetical protein [Nitrospiraceae bacterium]OQW33866.1 MAG: hypothetical protein A4E20_12485 [Nitrospira sp. SG-bin2]